MSTQAKKTEIIKYPKTWKLIHNYALTALEQVQHGAWGLSGSQLKTFEMALKANKTIGRSRARKLTRALTRNICLLTDVLASHGLHAEAAKLKKLHDTWDKHGYEVDVVTNQLENDEEQPDDTVAA